MCVCVCVFMSRATHRIRTLDLLSVSGSDVSGSVLLGVCVCVCVRERKRMDRGVCVFDTSGHVTALISRDAASADRGSLFTRKFRIPHYLKHFNAQKHYTKSNTTINIK